MLSISYPMADDIFTKLPYLPEPLLQAELLQSHNRITPR
jgi:hypothetical protein